jgi:quercetin dioxygenase-like cupin family protein
MDFHALPGRLSADPFGDSPEAQGLSTRIVRLWGGGRRSPHRHPRSAEVVYVAEGHGIVWVDGSAAPVSAGDVCLIPRGLPHATLPEPETEMSLICFFPDGELETNLEELDELIDVTGEG